MDIIWQAGYSVYANSVTEHVVPCPNKPSRAAGPGLAVGPPPSCLSSGGPRWRTCACLGTWTLSPVFNSSHLTKTDWLTCSWLPRVPLVQSPAATEAWRTTRNSSDLGWSRRNQPVEENKIVSKCFQLLLLSHLLEVEHVGGDVIAPLIVTLGTLLLDLPVPARYDSDELADLSSICLIMRWWTKIDKFRSVDLGCLASDWLWAPWPNH